VSESGSVTVESTITNTNFTSQPSLSVTGSIDISRYNEGSGSITASASIPASTVGLSGSNFTISNTYTLGAQARFLKTESKITAGSAALENIRMWAVNPDDFFGSQDSTVKTRGNFSNTGFTQITALTDASNAVLVNDDPSSATALIFSNSSGVNSLVGPITTAAGGTVFDMVGIDTVTSPIQKTGNLDGYGLFVARSNLAANASTSATTFFGAAPNASFSALKDQLIAVTDTSAITPTIPPADLNNLLAGIKPPQQTALPPPLAPVNAAPPPSNAPDPSAASKPPPQNTALDIDEPPPPPQQNSSGPAQAPGNEPPPPASSSSSPPPPSGASPPPGPASAAPAGAPPPVGSASAPPPANASAPKPSAPAPTSAPVTPAAVATTPVAPPPPSPVGDVKPPTPKDAADTGDKTLAAAAPPPPPAAASQPKRSNAPTNTVKVGSVSVETVAQANVPAAAGEQRFSLSGNSATW
jgi:hypothetical protein